MKILALCMDSTDYNSKSHEIMVMEELARLGNEIFLVTERIPSGYDVIIPDNIKHNVMPINGQLSEEQMNLLLSERYDVAFCSSFPGVKYVTKIAKQQGIKSICQVLDVPIFRLKWSHWNDLWKRNAKELEEADVIIGNIEITKQLLIQLNENLKDKITTIYYGINTEQADSIPNPIKKEPYIVWVSGIRWYKNLDSILFSLACLKNPPKLKVIGVGDGTEQEVQNIPFRIMQLAYHLGLDIEFVGGVDDVTKYGIIKNASLGVMNDISESIATMFVLECIYAGTPCISSDFPVCRDRYGDVAIYVENKYDTGEWAEKIREVLDNIDEHTRKAQQDREWIRENRSFVSQAKKLNEVFHNATR